MKQVNTFSGPIDLDMNEKHNVGRQLSQATYAVRGAVGGGRGASRTRRDMGTSKLANLVKP